MILTIALVVLASLGGISAEPDGLLDLHAMVRTVGPGSDRASDKDRLSQAMSVSNDIKKVFVQVVRSLKLDQDDGLRLKHLDIINREWTKRGSDYKAQWQWFRSFHKDIDKIIDLVLQTEANPAMKDHLIKRRWAEHGRRVGKVFDTVTRYARSAGGLPLRCDIDALLHLKKDFDMYFDETMGDFQDELNLDKKHPKFVETWAKFQSLDVIPESAAHLKQTNTACVFVVEALVNQALQIQKGSGQIYTLYDVLNTLWAFCLDVFAIFLRVLSYNGVDTSRFAAYHQIGNHANLFPAPPPHVTVSADAVRDVKRRLALIAKRIADTPDSIEGQRPVLETYCQPGQRVTSDMICKDLTKIARSNLTMQSPFQTAAHGRFRKQKVQPHHA